MKNEGKDIDEKEASESAVELNDLCRGNNVYLALQKNRPSRLNIGGIY